MWKGCPACCVLGLLSSWRLHGKQLVDTAVVEEIENLSVPPHKIRALLNKEAGESVVG